MPSSQEQPNFRSAVIWTYLFNSVSLLIAAPFGYAGICFNPGYFVIAAIMGLVFAGNLSTQLRHLKRVTRLAARVRPMPMLLTATKGWRSVELHPMRPTSAQPSIRNIRFITTLSGVPLTAHQGTPVEVYQDSADPDVLVLRLGDRLLPSDISFRYTPNNDDLLPVREYASSPTPTSTPHITKPSARVPATAQLGEAIERLAAENRFHLTIIMVIVAVGMLVGLYFMQSWQFMNLWYHYSTDPLELLVDLALPLVVAVGLFFLLRKLYHTKQQLLRSMELVRHTPPVPHPLRVTVRDPNETDVPTWLVHIGADDPPVYTITLLVPLDKTRAHTLSGTIGQVYATTEPRDPIIIQTIEGVLVGERQYQGNSNTRALRK
ncbi:MAG: hypothetical protein ACYDBB_14710 [Armatimonadota bacterium]